MKLCELDALEKYFLRFQYFEKCKNHTENNNRIDKDKLKSYHLEPVLI